MHWEFIDGCNYFLLWPLVLLAEDKHTSGQVQFLNNSSHNLQWYHLSLLQSSYLHLWSRYHHKLVQCYPPQYSHLNLLQHYHLSLVQCNWMQNNLFHGCLVKVKHIATARKVAHVDEQMPFAIRFSIQNTPAQTKHWTIQSNWPLY